jgi:acyl-CoA synthetase (NDP forming)
MDRAEARENDTMTETNTALAARAQMVHALLNPKNVAIVGATDRPGNWAQRVWRNLAKYQFPGAVYPMNPTRDEVWDTRCYRRFADLPEAPDHLVVLAPAKGVAAVLREGAAAGARSATIMSSGFSEAPDAEGQRLGRELAQVIAEAGLAVSGPNCLGNFNAFSRFFSMTDDRPHRFRPGPVAVFGQSGGIIMAIKRTLEERGIDTGALITSGNEAGLTSGDYIAYFAGHPEIRTIVCYLESVRDPEGFFAACRLAREAGKPVVLVKLGASDAGRHAAAAHTGALAGSMQAFDAVAQENGALRCRNLDDLVEVVEFLTHAPLPKGPRPGSITFSGGMRGLLLDMAEENGLAYPDLAPQTIERLNTILGVGTIIGNPLDSGFTGLTSKDAYVQCVEALLADPNIDGLLLQEELPRGPGSERKEANLRAVNELVPRAGKPVAFVSMISYGLTDYSRDLRDSLPNLPFLQECDKALRAFGAVAGFAAARARTPATPHVPHEEGRRLLAEIVARPGPATLDEVTSKRLLAAYGIPLPQEAQAASVEQAAAAAARIGYPVVLKAVSADLPHKSDAGAVVLNIADEAGLRAAYARIAAALAAHPQKPRLEGVLVAQCCSSGPAASSWNFGVTWRWRPCRSTGRGRWRSSSAPGPAQ